MPVTAQVDLNVICHHTGTHDFGTPDILLPLGLSKALTSGVAADMVDRVWADTRTLGASATEDLDLAGVLTDVYGAAITFVKIKMIFITAAAANTNNVNLTRPVAGGVPLFLAASDGIPILPGGAFVWFAPNLAGIAVTATTADLLTLTNSGGTTGVTFSIMILGVSA